MASEFLLSHRARPIGQRLDPLVEFGEASVLSLSHMVAIVNLLDHHRQLEGRER